MTRVSAAVHRLRGIYAIVDSSAPDPVNLTREVLDGGIRIVQYRAKRGIEPAYARAIRELTYGRDALFLLNDDWRAVDLCDADGVHLGSGDAEPSELPSIRQRLRGRILGLSCATAAEARAAERVGADYIGVGCVFPTTSKSDAGDPIGVAGLQAVAGATSLPVAAIGGINLKNIEQVAASGVAMAALLSAFTSNEDPRAVAGELIARWKR